VSRLRKELDKKNVKGLVVTMLDEVAWLFNLRGSDIDFNPGVSLNVITIALSNIYTDRLSLLRVCRRYDGHRYSLCR
jgi:Xaa-Pro aminopeptidase